MDFNEKSRRDGEFSIEIDWLNVLRLLWKKAWLIVILCVVVGSSAYLYTKLFVEPRYSSSITLYVNNKSTNNFTGTITPSEQTAAQSLVKTYIAILMTDDTIDLLKSKIDLDYTEGQLKGMISAAAIEDTEIFRVTVTNDSPENAQIIANAIIDVLRDRIYDITEGKMNVVNDATLNKKPVSPNAEKKAVLGAGIGAAIACVIIFVMALLDDVIHSEDYVVETYNMPVLAKIPDLVIDEPTGKYGRYSKRAYRSYYKHNSYKQN